jgi:hypothetical protein
MRGKHALVIAACLLAVSATAALSATTRRSWKPKATAVIEVRQPDGNLRVYYSPSGVVYWSDELPIIQGDRLVVHAFVSTGEATLKKAIIRLDNKELKTLTQSPWSVEINTAHLSTGYHFVEAVATAGDRTDIGTATFMVAPATDAVLKETIAPKPPEPTPPAPTAPELVCRVRSTIEAIDQALVRGETIILKEPTLFWVQAVPAAKEFQYTLERGGKETFRSSSIPIPNYLRLSPRQPDGTGLEPGEVTLTVKAGDGKGSFGPPAVVKIQVVSG